MPSKYLTDLRNRIANDSDASRCGLRSVSPEPTTEKGTRRFYAELDPPLPGKEQSSLIVSGPRSRKPTKDSEYYRNLRAKSRSRSRGRQGNSGANVASAAPEPGLESAPEPELDLENESTGELTDASIVSRCLPENGARKVAGRCRNSTSKKRASKATTSTNQSHRSAEVVRAKPRELTSSGRPIASNGRVRVQQAADCKGAEDRERRQRAYDLRHRIPRSPTPGSTDGEDDGQQCDGECDQMLEDDADELRSSPPPLPSASSESQYTYIYKTAGYKTLAAYAEAKYNAAFDGWPERDIYEAMEVMEKDQAHAVPPPAPETEVHVMEALPLRVGGGWHRANEPAPGSALGKRVPNRPNGGSNVKRVRSDDPNDTATELESDEDEHMASADPPAPPPSPPPPPSSAPAPQIEAFHPPIATLERQDTAATVLDTPLDGQPPSDSPSLGVEPSRFPTLPEFLSSLEASLDAPLRGPVHARLRRKVQERAKSGPAEIEQTPNQSDHRPGSPPPPPPPSPIESPPTPARAAQPPAPSAPRPPRTYARNRSHVVDSGRPAPDGPNSPGGPQPSPTRPSRTSSRSVLELLAEPEEHYGRLPNRHELKVARAEAKARAKLFGHCAEPSSLPKTTFSLQPPVEITPRATSQTSRRGSSSQSSCRLHPIAAARADMAAFDERCARENAPSFTESVTQQTSRVPRCEAPASRPAGELLPDNEENLAHAEAIAANTQPTRGRKKKPLARDLHGIRRQVLTYAKLHLFAYALVEGIYQTRATFLLWAAYVHEATWKMMLPHVPYSAATVEELEVMVNYIATLRGKLKDRVRPFIEQHFQFDPCVVTQEDIQHNLDIFNDIFPNSFHCTSLHPRKGHFEGEQLACCIAAALFYGPNSVGVMFPDYFDDMPLTVVAFILSIMQFCIEEWSDGYFVGRDLGASHMLDKYEAHLTNLKELRSIAPRRLQKMQAGWTEYAFDYSGASFLWHGKDREQAVFHAEMRPDTPPPSVPRESPAGSSRGGTSVCALAPASSLVLPSGEDLSFGFERSRSCSPNPLFDVPCTSTPRNAVSRSPSPPPEYNEHGCRTASSSGKGRAD